MDTTKLVYLKNVTQAEAQAEARKLKGRILTNKEIDGLSMQGILNPGIFPLWTGTHVDYSGTSCRLTENGKTVTLKIPEDEGWYVQDRFGFPSGKSSDSGNPDARYLWRRPENSGLLVRWDYWWCDWFRRYVYADYYPQGRLGVLISVQK